MKNQFNETGTDFGNNPSLPKLGKHELIQDSASGKEQIEKLKAQWPHPEESMKLVKWLMGYVNTKEEYEGLEQDLVELEFLTSLPSESTERRCCRNGSQVK
jgi:hypothetical protein